MKQLFDQNLSHRLVGHLFTELPGSAHVRELGLADAPDLDIWEYAAANRLMIVSKDVDFQQRALLFGSPPKVIWLRMGNCTTSAVAKLLRLHRADIQAFEADADASFLALT